jgi:4-amino-4-deoxy-L-arabinose transferase-like glycosyltransferase
MIPGLAGAALAIMLNPLARPGLWKAARTFLSSPWAVFVVAVVTRIAVFWQVLPVRTVAGFFRNNEQARIAWALASGYGFSSPWPDTPLLPTAQQPPLYPWILAGIFKLGGSFSLASLCMVVGFNTLLAALTGVLILKLGKRVFGEAVAIIASWVWAIWLFEAVFALRVWESSLSAFLLMLSLCLVLKLGPSSPLASWGGFGVLAGITALGNTSLLSVFVGLWLWLLITDSGWKSVRGVSVAVLFCVMTLLPWTARNYVEFHRFIPVRDNFGFELWVGNHEGESDATEYVRRGEIGFMESRRESAMDFIRRAPRRFLWRCGHRFLRFWTDPWVWIWLPISLLAWVGCLLALWRKDRGVMSLMIAMVLFPVVYYITHPGAPYRHPIEPVMLLLGVSAVMNVLGRVWPANARPN